MSLSVGINRISIVFSCICGFLLSFGFSGFLKTYPNDFVFYARFLFFTVLVYICCRIITRTIIWVIDGFKNKDS